VITVLDSEIISSSQSWSVSRRSAVVFLMLTFVKGHEFGISQSLRSVSDRPDPTGTSVSEARKLKNVQNTSQDAAEPAAAVNRK